VAVQRVQLQQALKNDHRAVQFIFKNAKEFGALDQPEAIEQPEPTEELNKEHPYVNDISDEWLRRLSPEVRKEFIRVGEELLAEKKAELARRRESEVSAPARPRNMAALARAPSL
jgi:hypothetical protein